MTTRDQFVQPRAIDLPVATPPLTAWSPVSVRPGQRRPLAGARDELAAVLRGANRESRQVFGSTSDPP